MEQQRSLRKISVTRSVVLIMIAGAFAVGIFIGRSTWLFSPVQEEREDSASQAISEEFRFIRQSLQPDVQDARKVRELQPFRYKVNALIEEKIEDGDASSVAVYFRDLDNGNWFGIGDQEPFSPESQVKIPLMIAYFKWAEANPLVLRKKLTAVAPLGANEPRFLRPPRTLEAGRSYSVNDLIFRMVAYGDNDAYALLNANLPAKHRDRIYRELYVNYDPLKADDALSLSAYASFFRVLFNASYLSEEMSEKALRYLSHSSFRSGMAAGVPPDIDLACKAGERTLETSDDDKPDVVQLHEFGIIYHPGRPFLLGVTARGTDYEDLSTVIRDITKLIYAEVDHQSN
jgi:beta-lactamase class A